MCGHPAGDSLVPRLFIGEWPGYTTLGRWHPPTSPFPPFLLVQNLSPKHIASDYIIKLKYGYFKTSAADLAFHSSTVQSGSPNLASNPAFTIWVSFAEILEEKSLNFTHDMVPQYNITDTRRNSNSCCLCYCQHLSWRTRKVQYWDNEKDTTAPVMWWWHHILSDFLQSWDKITE